MISRPAVVNIICSTRVVLVMSQPSAAPASAASAITARVVIHPTSHQLPPGGSASSRPTPIGTRTKTNGTTNAGSVYYHACSVVLYGSPPVSAAWANGDDAVGGGTSGSTAL